MNLNRTAQELSCSYQNAANSILETANRRFKDQDCLILKGKYRGRKARVHYASLADGTLTVYAPPYKLTTDGEIAQPVEFLNIDRAAREYRPLKDITFEVI